MNTPEPLRIQLLAFVAMVATPLCSSTGHTDEKLARLQVRSMEAFDEGDFPEVESLFEQMVSHTLEEYGENHANTAYSIQKFGDVKLQLGKLAEAEQSYRKSLDIFHNLGDSSRMYYFLGLGKLAAVFQENGEFDRAESTLEEASNGLNKLGDHAESYARMNQGRLALLYRQLGRYDDSEAIHRDLLATPNKFGDHNPIKNNLALVFHDRGQFDEASDLLEEVLRVDIEEWGEESPATLTTKTNLANAYANQGREKDAERNYLEILESWKSSFDGPSLEVASIYSRLADLLLGSGRDTEAIHYAENALSIRKEVQGEIDSRQVEDIGRLALLHHATDQVESAEALARKQVELRTGRWSNVLEYFSEEAALAFLSTEDPATVAGNLQSGLVAAETLLRFKGAIAETLATRRFLEESIPKTDELRQLLPERDRLGSEYRYALLADGPAHSRAQDLKKQLDSLNKTIRVKVPKMDRKLPIEIGLGDVQSALGPDRILIESFRYRKKTGDDAGKDFYASVVISSGDRKPVFIDHGGAEELEKNIETYRNAFDLSGEQEEDVEAWRTAEADLYSMLLEPLLPHLEEGNTVIFSVDSMLHFLPLGMIRNPDGQQPFEFRFPTRFVNSGRDLLRKGPRIEAGRGAPESMLLVANPDFQLGIPASDPDLKTDLARSLGQNLKSGLAESARNVVLAPLPGTADEAARIRSILEPGVLPETLTEGEAKELRIFDYLRQSPPGIIHFATHGFFLPTSGRVGNKDARKLGGESKPFTQNPMLRSGVALAGAQNTLGEWARDRIPAPNDDGILMAAEVATLDLLRTELVVLSACDTGVGKVLDGEGVLGLRRAFQTAGVQHLVLTLWPISDAATVEFMARFYEALTAGTPAPAALAATRTSLYEDWSEEFGDLGAMARLAPFVCVGL